MFHTAPRIPVRSLTLLFSILFASLAPAVARTITVDCNENKVSDALKMLDPDVSNTIRVIGTCHDSIAVNNFAQVTIAGVSTGGQNAAIQSLNGGPIFWIVGSHVQFSNLTLDGGLWAVMCREFSVCRFVGNRIQNTTGNGVQLDSADATFNGDLFRNNANVGLNLTSSGALVTQVTVKGTNAGTWGPGTGVEIDSGSTLTVQQLTVEANQGTGISIVGNSNFSNRPWAGPLTVSSNGGGGIWVTEQSSADISGAAVTNTGGGNAGAGVVIDGNSEASFWGGGTFTGNQSMDVYCGALNGLAAAPQRATIGVTNCPNTYN